MRKRIITLPIAMVATLSLAAVPAHADEHETDTGDVEECLPEGDTETSGTESSGTDELLAGAQDAALAAEALESEETDECEELEGATAALQAALDRIGANEHGNGVAAEVLAALIAGESPAGIGAEHGKAMAQAAAERRAERAAGDDEVEADEFESDDGDEDASQTEPATPASPATPATPAEGDSPATPATPASPATPATPGNDHGGRPEGVGGGRP